jgi:DNA processing protein
VTPNDAYLVLNLLPGIGPVRVKQMLEIYESPVELLERPASELGRLPGIGQKLAETLAGWRGLVDLPGELHQADRAGVRLVPLSDPDYPPLLRELHDPPLVLYVRGNANVLTRAGQCGLAVVGSRHHTLYGITATQTLVRSAVARGWVIVSGLARGIDTAAHQLTVELEGCTIAVLAGGLSQIYPPENLELARQICERGALVTEQPMLMKPDRRTFPMRNRIIAGLCPGTLVVEAGRQSGALITAHQAADQGRMVYAVPGRIDAPQSQGCHELIKQGAKLVESIQDIVEDVLYLPGLEPAADDAAADEDGDAAPPARPALAADLAPDEAAIVALLREGECSLEHLVARSGRTTAALLGTLSLLEIKRVVRQLPGRHYGLYNT